MIEKIGAAILITFMGTAFLYIGMITMSQPKVVKSFTKEKVVRITEVGGQDVDIYSPRAEEILKGKYEVVWVK